MAYTFISWNIDSLNAALAGSSERSALSRQVVEGVEAAQPDVFAIQETKLNSGQAKKTDALIEQLRSRFPEYEVVYNTSEPPARKGYAGTMMLYKRSLPSPDVDRPQIGAPDTMDSEGRILTLEFPDFFVVTVYTPNSGNGLVRLKARQVWDERFRDYIHQLDKRLPVFVGGDFNVAHEEIDLANPQTNHHSAGFTDEERADFTQLLDAGFTDSFRELHGDAAPTFRDGDSERSIYTWFAQRVPTAKAHNSGWRIDYWLASNRVADSITACHPLDTGTRQDHLPLELTVNL
ncbi:exodeoxyribonuclease III [Bifidobacterium actinocoloniiforme DSM 22766]|uniref:Exodeoxyribonuclease III n=1 Tax=Bifidobacterium actinocoloniiforme DSM 22766 TaxID=1437605 RepID=A0A086Z1D7_9BIFI|nr:exodeoxyribonuclease III [Bifidobacterium actinocoloniiforme]AKV55487.1 exodeoxyribonuclease [Bifidobacterium actinocoloniiforme DSM 22766]KFI40337.1 exodeoxyribonuclease III [Bifidobacterium actinocoloniiforme DSM 22766]